MGDRASVAQWEHFDRADPATHITVTRSVSIYLTRLRVATRLARPIANIARVLGSIGDWAASAATALLTMHALISVADDIDLMMLSVLFSLVFMAISNRVLGAGFPSCLT